MEKSSLVTKHIPVVEASLDYVFEPGKAQVPIAEARGKLMASYIDMVRCKISDYGERTLNDASNEQATRTFELSWSWWETGCLKDLTESISTNSLFRSNDVLEGISGTRAECSRE